VVSVYEVEWSEEAKADVREVRASKRPRPVPKRRRQDLSGIREDGSK
jgi:hypothetical protein